MSTHHHTHVRQGMGGAAPRGFTLLLALMIAGVLLTLGYEIYNLAVKEVKLSSFGRESQFAFYAADTGVECALYLDGAYDTFATTSAIAEVNCGVASSTLTRELVGTAYLSTFSFSLGPAPRSQCVDVRVTRDLPRRTVIESFGYNTCDLADPLRLQRAIRVTY